ncbi:MAG: DUF2065 domain-containing protein [Rhodospirillales bacterium]|nr:DUF2065 domain-containing protein [Alphaproteobacteria bacterium]USO03846.1 MAG: DUF2065 domain-containing protein [Rhodospirillales bacterium]
MGSLSEHLLLAFALIFVIEGLIYALFPDFIRKMMAIALMSDIANLRLYGLGMAGFGVCLLWLFKSVLLT